MKLKSVLLHYIAEYAREDVVDGCQSPSASDCKFHSVYLSYLDKVMDVSCPSSPTSGRHRLRNSNSNAFFPSHVTYASASYSTAMIIILTSVKWRLENVKIEHVHV